MPETPVADSILDSVKKVLGIEPDYDEFDVDIVMHINSAFSDLAQIGVGPTDGFEIIDQSTLWATFLENKKYLNSAKSFVFLKVRLLFDPPATSFTIDAFERQIKELEFRLSLYAPPANPVSTP